MSVKFFAQGNKDLPLWRFEPMRLAIMRLLVQRINHSAMLPLSGDFIVLLVQEDQGLSLNIVILIYHQYSAINF
jgi:hypothetical protein